MCRGVSGVGEVRKLVSAYVLGFMDYIESCHGSALLLMQIWESYRFA